MKSGRRVLRIVLTGAVVVGALVLVWPREREPEYKRKKLSEWLGLYWDLEHQFIKSPERDEAEVAVSQIGTNGLPFLLKWIRYAGAPARMTAIDRAIQKSTPRLWDKWAKFRGREYRRASEAIGGFEILGPRAGSAIPELTRITLDPTATETSWRTVVALGNIGSKALPSLLFIGTNNHSLSRARALESIGAMRDPGTNATFVVPAIVNCLGDDDDRVVMGAVHALRIMTAEPAVVVPALAKCLHHPNGVVRGQAAEALGRFSGAARAAVPQLKEALEDSDVHMRAEATNNLMRIAPEVLEKR